MRGRARHPHMADGRPGGAATARCRPRRPSATSSTTSRPGGRSSRPPWRPAWSATKRRRRPGSSAYPRRAGEPTGRRPRARPAWSKEARDSRPSWTASCVCHRRTSNGSLLRSDVIASDRTSGRTLEVLMRFAKSWRPVSSSPPRWPASWPRRLQRRRACGSSDDEGGGDHAVASSSTTPRRPSRPAEGLAEAFQRQEPRHHRRGRDAARRRRGRQRRQDPALHRRHDRRLHVQLRLAVPGPQPEQNLVPLTDEPWAGELEDTFKPTVSVGRQGLRRAVRQLDRRRDPLQQDGLREARPAGPEDLGRVHGQQRQDQGGRRRPGDPDLRGHLDLAAVRAGRLPQRGGRRAGLRREVHRRSGEVRHRSRRVKGFQHLRRSTRPATRTRTSAP